MDPPSLPRPQRPRRAWTPYIVLAAMLLLTTAAAYQTATSARGKERIRFEAAANRVTETIHSRLLTYIATATAGVGLYAASKSVELSEFHDFAAILELRRRYPGMQGLGFLARVKNEEALIQSMRDQGVPDFKLWPAHELPERYAVTSLEPADTRNKAAIGYDMSVEPALRAAMNRARDINLPAASGRVLLATEPQQPAQPGIVIFVPVYRNNTLHWTEDERKSALEGFVYCPFYADELFKGMFAAGAELDVDFDLFDDPTLAPAGRLYASGADFVPPFEPLSHYFTSINVAGQSWSLVFMRRAGAEVTAELAAAPIILGGGLILSLLLFGLMRTQARARVLAENAATELRVSEQSLRAGEQALRDAHEERSKLNEEVIVMQSRLLSELAAPLIPLSTDIVLMPLIGSLDAKRAGQVQLALANGVASRKAKVAVIDVTGVPAMDTEVAAALVKTAQVVRMLGAEVVLTGLRPAVAQTIVGMGIDLHGLVTRGDSQNGLEYARGVLARRPSR